MGARIDVASHITISTYNSELFNHYDYNCLNEEIINDIISNDRLKYLQTDQNLPDKVYLQLDKILAQRPDVVFRIFKFVSDDVIDLDVLKSMPHLKNLQIDGHLFGNQERIDCNKLCELTQLKSLRMDLFDLKDYSFIKGLPKEIEEIQIMADNMSGSVIFDCKWLLDFPELSSLFLGKKARNNITEISNIPKLKRLAIRGIKLDSFSFLKDVGLESFSMLYCTAGDITTISQLTTLRHLELWMIRMLDDISFVSSLKNLELLELKNLSRLKTLPDLSELTQLKKIFLQDTWIEDIPEEIQPIVEYDN